MQAVLAHKIQGNNMHYLRQIFNKLMSSFKPTDKLQVS